MIRLNQFLPYVCLAMMSCAACLLWLDSRKTEDHTMETIAADQAQLPVAVKSPLMSSSNHDLLLADLHATIGVSQSNG
ncbi:MAG TPA: hypothetical protein PKD54_15905, partial [Pirellulaceae bacterium]|nr:hypothetical protein [Pirellulaceae bacterium]